MPESLPFAGVALAGPDETAGGPTGEQQESDKASKSQYRAVVFKFLTTWMGFLILLVGVCLLTNVEWARPKIEEEMSSSFHRKVKLGRLSWTFGLNGLAIGTDRLTMLEANGAPFLKSGHSEIGVAFLPLFSKRVIIKHVEFHRPEVYATQVAPNKWNFSDLLVEGPEIRYVEVDDGQLHLRNELRDDQLKSGQFEGVFANTKWRSYDFQSVDMKLIFPRKEQQRQWPFYLAFKLPRKNGSSDYVSTVSLTVMANGTFDDWQSKKCTLDVRAEKVNPDDWRPFFHIPDGLHGLFGGRFQGDGVVAETMAGQLQCTMRDLVIQNHGNTIFSAPEGKCEARLNLCPKQFYWDQTTLRMGGLKVTSEGAVVDWKQLNPHYDLKLAADLSDLADKSQTSLWRFFPGYKGEQKKNGELNGSAVVELAINGDNAHQKMYTVLKATDFPLSHLLGPDSGPGAPLLSLFEIKPNASIAGRIEISPERMVLLKDVQIPAKGGLLKVQGFIDAAHNQHDVYVAANDLALDKFDTAQLDANRKPDVTGGKKAAVEARDILLTGKIDLDAHFKADKGKQQTDVSARLKGDSLSAGTKTPLARSLNGTVSFDGQHVKFNAIRGVLSAAGSGIGANASGGSFTLNGSLGVAKNDVCNVKFNGDHVDIGSLVSFTKAAHIPVPESAVGPMQGSARQLEIGIKGKCESPDVALTLSPDDMTYSMANTNAGAHLKPLRVSGGTISFVDEDLELKDVSVSSQTGKLILSASFHGQPDKLMPRYFHLKSTGIEVPEVEQYVNSQTLPSQSRTAFANLVAPLGLNSVQGKIYGELKVDMSKSSKDQPPSLEGVIGLNHVSGHYGANGPLVDHINGLISASGEHLSLQDVSATLGASHVTMHGDIKKFQSASPSWRIEASGNIRPQDLMKYLPQAAELQKSVACTSTGPLHARCSVTGDTGGPNKIVFNAQCDPSDDLNIQGAFGNFTQPAGTPVTLDGNVVLSSHTSGNSLDVQSCHITIGDSIFQGSGKYQWALEEPESRRHDRSAGDSTTKLDCNLATPNPVPLARVMKVIDPLADVNGVAGTVKMTLGLAGSPGNLLTRGDIALAGIAVPALQIKDLNGHIHTPRWSVLETSAGQPTKGDAVQSEAQMSLSRFNFGAMPIRDLEANIVLVHGGSEPKISISNGAARLAGGKMTLNLQYGTESSKWHMDLGLKQLQVDEFISNLIEHSGEITGLADGKIVLDSVGANLNTNVRRLNGHGEISIYKGTVPKVGQLQEKLTQANLFQQGVFGFNLNNVLQSVLPVKTGNFDEAGITFAVNDGNLEIERMIFDGNDLRLRAAGVVNLVSNNVTMDVAGNIPRVSSSILPGAVGEMSKHLTIQKAVRVVTFRKLENLPALPILGDIATDDRRAFTFKVAAELSNPDGISHSIQKTFKWLPNKPNASAHPVPGINLDVNSKPSASLSPEHHHSLLHLDFYHPWVHLDHHNHRHS